MEEKCHAIVLRHADYGDYDRMVTLLSPELGLISASMKGCRRPKAKLRYASELFCFGEYILVRSKSRAVVIQCLSYEMFYPLRVDIDKFAFAAYMLNLAETNAEGASDAYPLFALLIESLKALAFSENDPFSALAVYLIKLSDLTGYRPLTGTCCLCGDENASYFNTAGNGMVCRRCCDRNAVLISGEALHMLERVLNDALKKAEDYRMPETVAKELIAVLVKYIGNKNEKNYKSAQMVKQIINV